MTTDKQNKWLAEQVYWVDEKRDDVKYHPTERGIYDYESKNVELDQFKVLKVEDNPTNGMQAMAVVMMEVCL